MKRFQIGLFLIILTASVFTASDLQKEAEPQAGATQEELSASVPELSDLHEVVFPLWHTAFPDKDFGMIKELLPQMDVLTRKLDEAQLPGILRDKKTKWEEGKQALKSALAKLHKAADEDNQEEMLKQTEAFHSAFERLVRTIRPLVSELVQTAPSPYRVMCHLRALQPREKHLLAVASMLLLFQASPVPSLRLKNRFCCPAPGHRLP